MLAQSPCSKGINANDLAELKKFYNTSNGEKWYRKDNWNSTKNLDWYGVRWTVNADECRVDSLYFYSNNLIINNLQDFNLPFLKYLTLYECEISGEIPDFDLPNLQYLNLDNGSFQYQTKNTVHSLPSFSKLKKLKYLNISNHVDIKGTIPNYDLPILEKLRLNNCAIEGEIPALNLPMLKSLYFYNDTLILGFNPNLNLPNLEDLNLINAKNISTDYAFLAKAFPKLKYLEISGTPKINYQNPDFLFPNLINLYANENQYEGTFSIKNMPKLTTLELNKNKLDEIQSSNNNILKDLNINHNSFNGKIDFIENFKELETIDAEYNQFDTAFKKLTNKELTRINLANNMLKVNLEIFDSLPKLNFLYIAHNQIYDSKNNINLKSILSAQIQDNNLTFNGLSKINIAQNRMNYAPQTKIPLLEKVIFKTLKMLYVEDNTEDNYYDWRKENSDGVGSSGVAAGTQLKTFIPRESGKYFCIISNKNYPGLNLVSEKIEVQVPDNEEDNLSVFPSINDGNFSIFLKSFSDTEVNVFTQQGQLIYQDIFIRNQEKVLKINLPEVSNGIYFVQIRTKNMNLTRKIRVQH
jgi:hypothetical protein